MHWRLLLSVAVRIGVTLLEQQQLWSYMPLLAIELDLAENGNSRVMAKQSQHAPGTLPDPKNTSVAPPCSLATQFAGCTAMQYAFKSAGQASVHHKTS